MGRIRAHGDAMTRGGEYLWEQFTEQCQIGWQRLSILELAAIPSLQDEHWLPALAEADVIMVGGLAAEELRVATANGLSAAVLAVASGIAIMVLVALNMDLTQAA